MDMDGKPLLPLWISEHWLLVSELLQSLFQQGFESRINRVMGTVKEACQIYKDLLPGGVWHLFECDLDGTHDLRSIWVFFQTIAQHGIRMMRTLVLGRDE